MYGDHNRYFIELQPDENSNGGVPAPRWREAELRRAVAARFVEIASDWLRENDLAHMVSMMSVTALGQVQITCQSNVISHIRNQDMMQIAAIRQGVMYVEPTERWNEAR